jgi:hypothetical protein
MEFTEEMDKHLQKLKRQAAAGDPVAQAAYDQAFLKVCTHKKGTYLGLIGGMWGTGAQWCAACGKCMSDPEQPPRPEGARGHRKFTKSMKAAAERLENMTPAEREEFDERLREKLREHRKNSPFRRRPISPETWNRMLD